MSSRFVAFIVIACSLCCLAQDKRLHMKYDRFKDTSLLGVRALPLKLASYWTTKAVYAHVGFIFPGQELRQAPEGVDLLFEIHSESWRFLEESRRSAILLIDGERIMFRELEYEGKISRGVIEYLTIYLTMDQLRRIAYAGSVEVQLGGFVECAIKAKELAAVRALYEVIPGSTPPGHPTPGGEDRASPGKTCYSNGIKVPCRIG